MVLQMLTLIRRRLASTAARKSKVKSQKSKVLYSRLSRHLKWYVYLRSPVLVTADAIAPIA